MTRPEAFPDETNLKHSNKNSLSVVEALFKTDVFGPELFKENVDMITAKLEAYLADKSIRGLSMKDPAELLKKAKSLMTGQHDSIPLLDTDKLEQIIDLYIKTGIQVHSPGFMGRQFSGVLPLTGAFDMIGSIVNQPSSFYEAGQLPNVAERIMSAEFNKLIGYEPDSFAMVTTSGGSLANLTAILAARNDKFPEIWSTGNHSLNGKSIPAVAVSEDVHYSIKRAVGILGIGESQIVKLPLDREMKIDVKKIIPTLDKAEERGLKVFCMIGSAGTTSSGAIDPLNEIAAIAEQKEIWLHIDGAHGASLLVSDKLRHKLTGIEKADSFCWDAHKMIFVPAVCTMLFYKNKEKSYGAFSQDASYVFEKKADKFTEYDSAEKTFECTKRPLIMNLWVIWSLYGKSLFSNKIEHLYNLTQSFYQLLVEQDDFKPLHKPEMNIISFHYVPVNVNKNEISSLQCSIRETLRQRGTFFISKVDIDGITSLRVVFMNHLINLDHCNMLLDEIRKIGQEILNR